LAYRGSAAQDVGALLEDRHSDHQSEEEYEFSSTSYYERRDATGNRWQGEWVEFVETIKTRERFFSPKAEKLLRSVFGEISSMRTFGGRSLIIDAGPGTLIPAVFRARVFQSITALNEALIRPRSSACVSPTKARTSRTDERRRNFGLLRGG
jgi:hypothetical protein